MPPMPAGAGGAVQGPSTFDKAKMGAMMGGSVGIIIGFIFGATNIIRFGPGPNGMLRTLGQYMAGSAATFGFFMSIGTTIRTESSPIVTEAFRKSQARNGRPMIMPLDRSRKLQRFRHVLISISNDTGSMATAGGRIGSELDRLMQDVKRNLARLADDNNALSNRLATLELSHNSLELEVNDLSGKQGKIEGRISDLHTRIEDACSSHEDLTRALDSIRKDCSASKGAIDEILEQHNSLAANVQDLARPHASVATTGLSPVAEGHKSDSKHPASEPAIPAQSDDANNSSSQDSFKTTVEQDIAAQAMTLLNDKQNTMLPPPRPDPAVTRNPALQRGRRAAVSSPPKPAFQREASVASTITLRGDDSPAKNRVDLPPPAPVARRGLRPKSPARMKRKLSEAASELPTKQKTAGGGKKRRVAASRASKEGTPNTGDECVATADTMDDSLDTGTVNSTQTGPSAIAGETVVRGMIDTEMKDEIEEGENIVVLPRKALPRYGTSQQDFAPSSTLNGLSGDDMILATDATGTGDVQPSAVERPQGEAGSRGISPETPEKTSLNDLRAIFQVRSGGKALPSAAFTGSPIVYTRTGKSTQSTREKNKKKAIGK
ncbi:hypothetical protein D0869_07826 [Hortaea werneckii]|uniref:Uncharacterized protein n=2 Tax=Hortaea werneckii TaxID=91943 RepID=A0A3M6YLF7_HORWE|nr:hypothetical protein KC334_g10979 [Hortaea werneckii]KAI6983786.1 hypothetical protein KC355_g10825 [Hortaea werneckii]KAI7657842.1 hypothetical protein KC318_g11586 [Hortaea werneckii]RMX80077.1 hypothetical protein D0869_07826 [Hortaea werneckii]RMY03722.1 hypothetical protein D0868_07317 [Hortaea werneckii]